MLNAYDDYNSNEDDNHKNLIKFDQKSSDEPLAHMILYIR